MENEGLNLIISSTVLIGVFAGACGLILMYIIKLFNTDQKNVEELKNEKYNEQSEKKKQSGQSGKSKKKTAEARWTSRSEKQGFTHPWLLTSLKGHTGQVLDMDFSSNGKYLASCAGDRAVLLWDTKDLTQKEHKSSRVNIDYDYATFIKWSPDSKAFIINKYNANAVEVYKVEKKKDGLLGNASKVLTFDKAHEEDVIAMGIACNGKFIMTCSNKTDLVIWDLKGQQLTKIDTYLMNTVCAKISPCGRFIVASGFAPDVKVWEVVFNKVGEYQETKRVFELTGHTSGVHDVAFDVDTSHMATVSKDGTWKLFDTKIDYKRGESPCLKITGKYEQTSGPVHIALSPNAEVVVVATSNILFFYSAISGELDYTIDGIGNGDITSILFDSLGKHVLACVDKHIRVFHNVTGYRCNIITAKEKLKQHPTSATKERLEELISDSQSFLYNMEKKQ